MISKSEKEDFLAAKALDENWSQAKCMKFGIDRFMLKRARRMTAAGWRALLELLNQTETDR